MTDATKPDTTPTDDADGRRDATHTDSADTHGNGTDTHGNGTDTHGNGTDTHDDGNPTSRSEHGQRRRDVLRLAGVGGVALVAGCVSTTDNGDDGTTTPADGDTSTDDDDGTATTDDGGNGDGETYTIGMVDSLTGSLSAFGERNQRGMELALADVHDRGIRGGELDIIVEDDQSESQPGVSAAQKLVNQDGVPFVIGAVGSGVSLAIYQSVIQGTVAYADAADGLLDNPEVSRLYLGG
jgi:hypothetical protein